MLMSPSITDIICLQMAINGRLLVMMATDYVVLRLPGNQWLGIWTMVQQ